MRNIQKDKTVTFLVPHSGASAFAVMVRLLSRSHERNLTSSWLESQSGCRISDGK